MKVWEAHKALADAVGDNADISDGNLYDGVRYTKKERDNYLYSALIQVFNKLLYPILALPLKQRKTIVNRMFPNMVRTVNFPLNQYNGSPYIYRLGTGTTMDDIDFALTLDLNIVQTNGIAFDFTGLPIPFKTSEQVAELISSRNAFKPDLFYTYYVTPDIGKQNLVLIYDYQSTIEDIALVGADASAYLTYLEYPTNPANQATNDDLGIEKTYTDMVINSAIIMMFRDDQAVQSIESTIPTIQRMQQ